MNILRIADATRVIGKSQGYLGLPVRDELVKDNATGQITPCMTTAWEPTPAELAALNAGAPIYLHLYGTSHPPVLITVGPTP